MGANLETWTQMQQVYHDLKSSVPSSETGIRPYLHLKLQRSISDEDSKHQYLEMCPGTAPKHRYDASDDRKFLSSMVPPDGGTIAWLQVLASCLININTFGLCNSFGVYQEFYASSYLKSYSNSEISWIGTTQAALLLLVGSLAGPLFDLGHFRLTFWSASISLVFAQMMLSISKQYYQVMLLFSSSATI
jgi:hypothetical protein